MKKFFLVISILALMSLAIPLSLSAMEYQHKLEVKNMQFLWTIEGELIHIRLSAKTTGWVAVGFGPEKAMSGANIIIGAVKNGRVKIEDHYANRKRGHASDEKLGGTNDVLNPSGTEEDGITTVSFSFPLNSGDKYDKPVNPESTTRVMLAYGAGEDSFRNHHLYRTIYEINLSTGENKKVK
ncbi:MAG: DOMON domain-containing protein [Deltaproteobacteria bacterium]|nr:DOMON domain-containing protein [Deltaproteobacteria bacterium]